MMRQTLKLTIITSVIFLSTLISSVHAQGLNSCGLNNNPKNPIENTDITFSVPIKGTSLDGNGTTYEMRFESKNNMPWKHVSLPRSDTLIFKFPGDASLETANDFGTHKFQLMRNGQLACEDSYTFIKDPKDVYDCSKISISPRAPSVNDNIVINYRENKQAIVYVSKEGATSLRISTSESDNGNNVLSIPPQGIGNYIVYLESKDLMNLHIAKCKIGFTVSTKGGVTSGTIDRNSLVPLPRVNQICDSAGTKVNECETCINKNGAWTAIGCLTSDANGFFQPLLKIGIGIAGGLAFLIILFGGFQVLTSAGNPEQLNAGKELIGSAIAGLLLVAFSVFILKLLSVNIFGIPGFE